MADVSLTCGCTTVATHERGDRLIRCKHGQHVVTADHASALIYTARAINLPDPDGPAAA